MKLRGLRDGFLELGRVVPDPGNTHSLDGPCI